MKMKSAGAFIIASAVIWAAVIVGSAYTLRGTECYDKIQNILFIGVISHLILIWGPFLLRIKKSKED